MPEVRFVLSQEVYHAWQIDAAKHDLRLSQYAKMRALGIIGQAGQVVGVTAGVRELREEAAAADEGGGMLRDRILRAVVGGPFRTIDLGRVASALGVSRRQVLSSVGSMVATGRLRREGETYYVVKQEN